MEWDESALRFSFGPLWVVRRYDAHRFYRAISGADMKGVDFVAIHADRSLVFIEVKNYTRRYGDQLPDKVPPLDDPAAFAARVSRKWADSLRAVRVFRLALLRRRRYRYLHRVVGRFLAPAHDWRFWTRAYELSRRADSVHALLWLELADSYPGRFNPFDVPKLLLELREALDAQLPAGISSVSIANTHMPPDPQSLRARRL